jgi:hypothetical protein
MKTVVLFVETGRNGSPKNGWKNKIYTRDLRKIGFIDNRYMEDNPDKMPGGEEYWLVKILRENQSRYGKGCFILRPIKRIVEDDLLPLVHGMYDMRLDEGSVVIEPHNKEQFWIMSPAAKKAIQSAFGEGSDAVVIDHGGGMWARRKPAEDVVEDAAERILKEVEKDG